MDAESGGFSLSITKRKNKIRYTTYLKLIINIVFLNNEEAELSSILYFSIFSKVCKYFKTSLISRTKCSPKGVLFKIIAYNSASKEMVMEYFEKFPLLGEKALDYVFWREAILKIKNKEHFHSKEVIDIKIAKRNLNRSQVNNIFTTNLERLRGSSDLIKQKSKLLIRNSRTFTTSAFPSILSTIHP
jgi:hypothetical protein